MHAFDTAIIIFRPCNDVLGGDATEPSYIEPDQSKIMMRIKHTYTCGRLMQVGKSVNTAQYRRGSLRCVLRG